MLTTKTPSNFSKDYFLANFIAIVLAGTKYIMRDDTCAFTWFAPVVYWRGHQTSYSGEFKRQTASEIAILIRSFLRNCSDTQSISSWFYEETEIIMFLCDGFRKTDLGIDLIANAFCGSIQNTRLFSLFSLFIFCSIIYLVEKRKGAYSCLPAKDSLNYSLSLFKE